MSPTPATVKWLMLIADIVGYEVQHTSDGQLLSEACDRWIARHPIAARVFIVCIGELLILHLANLIDQDYDIVSQHFWRRNILWLKGISNSPPRGK